MAGGHAESSGDWRPDRGLPLARPGGRPQGRRLRKSLQKTGTKKVKAKNCPLRCLLVSDGNKKSLLIKIRPYLIFTIRPVL